MNYTVYYTTKAIQNILFNNNELCVIHGADLLFHALVNIDAPIPDLPVARGADAGVAALRVDAVLLAPVLPGGALVHVAAGPPVAVQGVAGRTLALVRTESIVAFVLARVWLL